MCLILTVDWRSNSVKRMVTWTSLLLEPIVLISLVRDSTRKVGAALPAIDCRPVIVTKVIDIFTKF